VTARALPADDQQFGSLTGMSRGRLADHLVVPASRLGNGSHVSGPVRAEQFGGRKADIADQPKIAGPLAGH
jgi:hypothetical protein